MAAILTESSRLDIMLSSVLFCLISDSQNSQNKEEQEQDNAKKQK